uniref:Cell division protein n=1 Tax=Pseudochloris wilhelmii TaxID=1418016 RepID=A0A097KQM5_9CHLO|nr:cell division protein [Pseudochloris wilhelmii]AIT95488.1 cell division protein [Pseudochloris wilhelmii]
MNRYYPNKGKYYLARRNTRLEKIKDLLSKYLNINLELNHLDDNEPIPAGPLLKIFIETELKSFFSNYQDSKALDIKVKINESIENVSILKLFTLIPQYTVIKLQEVFLSLRGIIMVLNSTEFQTISQVYLASNIEEARFAIRAKIPQLNVFGAFGMIPFILGLSYFLRSKYSNANINLVLRDTLPIFSQPLETIAWETFEYNTKHDLEIEDGSWYEDSIVVRKKIPNQKIFINGITQSFVLESNINNNSRIKKIFLNPDQLPLKLESFNSNIQENPSIIESKYSFQSAQKNQINPQLEKPIQDKQTSESQFNNLYNQYCALKSKYKKIFQNKNSKISFYSLLESFFEQEKFINNAISADWLESTKFPITLPNWDKVIELEIPILLEEEIKAALTDEVETLNNLKLAKQAFFGLAQQAILRDRPEGKMELIKEEEQAAYTQKLQELWGLGDDNENLNSETLKRGDFSEQEFFEESISEEQNQTGPSSTKLRLAEYMTALANLEISPEEIAKQITGINKSIRESKRTINFLNVVLAKNNSEKDQRSKTNTKQKNQSLQKLYQFLNIKDRDELDALNYYLSLYINSQELNTQNNKKTLTEKIRTFFQSILISDQIEQNCHKLDNNALLKRNNQNANLYKPLIHNFIESYSIPTRQMSGYTYPDMRETNLLSNFIWELFFGIQNHNWLKIALPTNFAALQNFVPKTLDSFNVPITKIKIGNQYQQNFNFKNQKDNPPIPPKTSDIFDPIRNFDLTVPLDNNQKQGVIDESKTLYDWFWDRVSPYNPFAIQQVHYATDDFTWASKNKPSQSWPTSLYIQEGLRTGKRDIDINEIEELKKEYAKSTIEKNEVKNKNEKGVSSEKEALEISNIEIRENIDPNPVDFTSIPTSEFFGLPKIGPIDTVLREHNSFLPWENDVYMVPFSSNEWKQQLNHFETALNEISKKEIIDKVNNPAISTKGINEIWEDWQTQLLILQDEVDSQLAKKIESFRAKEDSTKKPTKKKKNNKKKSKEQSKDKKENTLLKPIQYSLVKTYYPQDSISLLPLITIKRPISSSNTAAFDTREQVDYHFTAPFHVQENLNPVFELNETPYENFLGTNVQTYHRVGAPLVPQAYSVSPIEKVLNTPFFQNQKIQQYLKNSYVQNGLRRLKLIETNLFGPTHWEGFQTNFGSIQNWILALSGIGLSYLIFLVGQDALLLYARETLYYIMVLAVQWGLATPYLKQQISFITGEKDFIAFRILPQINKNWRSVAGARIVTPELVDMVLTLRMMQKFKTRRLWRTFPTGFLFHGPPGTGKTLLVQILASEAQVPVISISAESILQDYTQGDDRLEMAFEEAQRLAPSILFIDEIDGLGERRPEIAKPENRNWWLTTFWEEEDFETIGDEPIAYSSSEPPKMRPGSVGYMPYYAKRTQQLRKLVILLVELDDISKYRATSGIVVIGATNRLQILDPALRRPGRLENQIYFELPDAEKRAELIKLYSKGVEFDSTLIDAPTVWNYILERTYAFTPADLAMVMKESAVKSIISNSKHTVETIEHGIERLVTEKIFKPKNSDPGALSSLQLAYHQAGKIILSAVLADVIPVIVAHLWPHELNSRGKRIQALREEKFLTTLFPQPFGNRLIACYGGLAAETLFLQYGSSRNAYGYFSTLGLDDIVLGERLSQLMITSKYFYSTNFETLDWINISSNWNQQEFTRNGLLLKRRRIEAIADDKVSLDFEFKQFLDPDLTRETEYKFDEYEDPNQQVQERTQDTGWWYNHFKTIYQDHDLGFDPSGRFARKIWFRDEWNLFYYDDQKTWKRNLDWLKPEIVLQTHQFESNLSPTRIKWSDISDIQAEYQRHSLILNAFNKALLILEENRELLDTLVYALIEKKILRAPEINNILEKFSISTQEKAETQTDVVQENRGIRVISRDWGKNSRKPDTRWLNIDEIQQNVKMEL